jgi:hypothetical protein
VRPLYVKKPVDCRDFRSWVCHLQADELADADRETLLEHSAACGACARYLETEDSFLRALKGRLVTEVAPDGLETRVREALEREAPAVGRWGGAWLRTPAVSVLAASALLAVLLVPTLVGTPSGDAGSVGEPKVLHVVKTVTVVDRDCDRVGATFAQQLACRNARHLNVLKLGDGSYWNVNLDHPSARDIVMDPNLRGRRITVEADFYPDLQAVQLIRVSEASSRL